MWSSCILTPPQIFCLSRFCDSGLLGKELPVVSAGGRTPLDAVLLCAETGRTAFPRWGSWLAGVGAWAAELAKAGVTGVIAVSVPARPFAAVLLGCGAVHGGFQPQLAPTAWQAQFERAKALKPGTCVRLVPVTTRKSFVGLLEGVASRPDGSFYRVGGSLLPADRYRVDRLAWPDDPAEFIGRERTAEELDIPAGAAGLLPGIPEDFCGFSALHCVLVGEAGAIMEEAGTAVAISPATAPVELYGLLRPRRVRENGRQYRSLVLPAREDPFKYQAQVRARKPRVVVLDGAATVCRWMGSGLAPLMVAVVERTAPSADAAADMLDRYRARSAQDLALPPDLSCLPAGTEILAWRNRGAGW